MADTPKAQARKAIIARVLHDHGYEEDELLGRGRGVELVAARKDAAQRLLDAGFSRTRIAKILKRDHTTVGFYFSETQKAKLGRMSGIRVLDALPPDTREIITKYAAANNSTPRAILIDWVVERAEYEAAAKARAAA